MLVALRRHLAIDDDPACAHRFVFGKSTHLQYSDNAYTRLRDAIPTLDLKVVWREHRPGSKRTMSRPVPAEAS
jgi:hypothetical protein